MLPEVGGDPVISRGGRVAGSVVSVATASKRVSQRPQRTWPSRARSCRSVTRKAVLQVGHRVIMLIALPPKGTPSLPPARAARTRSRSNNFSPRLWLGQEAAPRAQSAPRACIGLQAKVQVFLEDSRGYLRPRYRR